MKRRVALLGVLAAMATAAVLLITPATGSAWPGAGAGWTGDNAFGQCAMLDQNGDVNVLTGVAKLVVASDGSRTLICKVQGVANDTGHAVTFSGFLCSDGQNITDITTETISKTGNATLNCYFAPPPV